MYDIIGDIHGYADELEALLQKMGYEKRSGCYRHPERKVVFVGDLIDRGPKIREVLEIVQPMVEERAALIVMGNHEFNALAFHTPDPERPGEYLREHRPKKVRQHQATLDQVGDRIEAMLEFIRSMPLWLELPELRVVHACWDPESIGYLAERLSEGRLDREFLVEASRKGTREYQAVENVLKGRECSLGGATFLDKGGEKRSKARIRWYLPYEGQGISEYSFQVGAKLPDCPFDPAPEVEGYGADERPVFFGHYWLKGERPELQAPNVCCLDYSVADVKTPDAFLCAYRFEAGESLRSENYVWVRRGEAI